MTFDEQRPDALVGSEVEMLSSLFVKTDQTRRCAKCNRPTTWVESSFQTWVCSSGCGESLWAQFEEAAHNSFMRGLA